LATSGGDDAADDALRPPFRAPLLVEPFLDEPFLLLFLDEPAMLFTP
jgi:hypothetical protein